MQKKAFFWYTSIYTRTIIHLWDFMENTEYSEAVILTLSDDIYNWIFEI